jgi:hypothetical protein
VFVERNGENRLDAKESRGEILQPARLIHSVELRGKEYLQTAGLFAIQQAQFFLRGFEPRAASFR